MAAGEEILRDGTICSKAQKCNQVCFRAKGGFLGVVAPEIAMDYVAEDQHIKTFGFWVLGIII